MKIFPFTKNFAYILQFFKGNTLLISVLERLWFIYYCHAIAILYQKLPMNVNLGITHTHFAIIINSPSSEVGDHWTMHFNYLSFFNQNRTILMIFIFSVL